LIYKRKGHDRVDGYYTGKTGNEYFFEVKQEQMMQVLTYSTVIEKSNLNLYLMKQKY
jgi:hypothetical protein